MSWKKFTAFNSQPTSKSYPDLPQNITYLRLFLGLAYGISLAFRENIQSTKLSGGAGLIFGLNIVTFIPIIYMNYYLNVKEGAYKGLNFAGVANGLALLVLVWVTFFTLLHEDEENYLSRGLVLSNVAQDGVEGLDGASSGGDLGGQGGTAGDLEF